jgi:phosphoserine phosphatase RsbU/P
MFPNNDEQNRLIKENLNLKFAVEELSILNDIAAAISSTKSLDQIINLIVRKCVKYLKAEEGAVHLANENDFRNVFQTMIRVKNDPANTSMHFNKQISDQIYTNKKPLMINKFRFDEEYTLDEKLTIKINSLLSVPMMLKGKMIGVLSLFNKKDEAGFTENDKRLLSIIAAQSAHVIENSRLFDEEKKFIAIQQELKIAAEIQKHILPKKIPEIEGYDLYGANIPALEVGGDYFDFINISDSVTVAALGDVSGKGVPASMLMANLQATLRAQLLSTIRAKECIYHANQLLLKSTDKRKFVTLFFAMVDNKSNSLTYCNAGHNIPVFIQDGKQVPLNKGGIILGWKENAVYTEETIPFEPGATLVIYSDGITEALSDRGEAYGEDRLIDLVKEKHTLNSRNLVEKIFEDVKEFSSGLPQSDDMTLLVIKRI